MIAHFHHHRIIAPTVYSFYFKPQGHLRFTPGQFIELTVPHDHPDSRGTRRWLTVSSAPHEPYLILTTKLPPVYPSTFKQALLALTPGKEVIVSDALGDFVLPMQTTTPALFVAAGIGITPVRSIASWLQHTGKLHAVSLMHVVSSKQEQVFQDIFESAGISMQYHVSTTNNTSRFSADVVLHRISQLSQPLIYLSGPEGFTQEIANQLKARGVSPGKIVTDYFPGYNSL